MTTLREQLAAAAKAYVAQAPSPVNLCPSQPGAAVLHQSCCQGTPFTADEQAAKLTGQRISAIICARGETVEDVGMTADSLLALKDEVGGRLDVLVVDDNGDGQHRYDSLRSRAAVHENAKPLGRGASANMAYALVQGHPLFPDAHMRFRPGAIREIAAALALGAITCCGVQDLSKETGAQGYGANFWFHRGGGHKGGRLGVQYARQPGNPQMPFGGCYGFPRKVFERLGGWTDVAGRWGYCEQPMGFAAWALGIPVISVPSIVQHRFRPTSPHGHNERELWLNVLYPHFIMFQPVTFEKYWLPLMRAQLSAADVDSVVKDPKAILRRKLFLAQRSRERTDEKFFREVLRVDCRADAEGNVLSVPNCSIILPANNEGDEPVLTARSIMASTRRDPEILFVDDASTDGCCAETRPDGSRRLEEGVRVVRNAKRIGVTQSRRVGIVNAQEDPLGFMDAHSRAQPGDIDRLIQAALDVDGLVVATITGLGEKRPLYGSRFCVKPKWGLRGAYNLERPKENLNRINMAMGSCYFIKRAVLDKIRSWPPLPGMWAYSEQGVAMKCWALDVPIYNLRDVLIEHKMRKGAANASLDDVLMNAHFIHRAYFDEETYLSIWRPLLKEHGWTPRIDEVLKSKDLLDEAAWYQANRKHTDEQFFREVLGARPEDFLTLDREAGRAVPHTQAEYIAYESRRSPGREWTADRERMKRHVADLVAHFNANHASTRCTLASRRLLDIGSRDGWALDHMVESGFGKANLQGLELVPWAAAHARSQGRNVLTGDAHELPFPEASFSLVTCIHCLEHCPDPAKVLTGIRRVLCPGGVAMIVVPIEPTGLSVAGDHCRAMRSEADVRALVEAAGLRVVQTSMRQVDAELTLFASK